MSERFGEMVRRRLSLQHAVRVLSAPLRPEKKKRVGARALSAGRPSRFASAARPLDRRLALLPTPNTYDAVALCLRPPCLAQPGRPSRSSARSWGHRGRLRADTPPLCSPLPPLFHHRAFPPTSPTPACARPMPADGCRRQHAGDQGPRGRQRARAFFLGYIGAGAVSF